MERDCPAILLPSTGAADAAPEVLERLVRCAEFVGASDIHLQMTGATAACRRRVPDIAPPIH